MSKYFDTKSLIEDLNDMMVELREQDIKISIHPTMDSDIQIKMLSIGRMDMLTIRFDNLDNLEYQKDKYNLIHDKISMIFDFMSTIDIDTRILCLPIGHTRTKYKDQYERYGLQLSLDELRDFFNRRDIKTVILTFAKKVIVNESLPNQKTVDQLKMVARLSKKTDIGNRIPDENGSNMRYMRNPIDNLESREDYDKKNKDYIPSWNLKHLLSPFKGKNKHKVKIKRLKESQSEMIEFDDDKYDIVYGEDIIADTDFGVYRSYDDNKRYLVSKNDIDMLDSDNFTFEGLAVTKKYYLLASDARDKYIEVKADADSIRSSDKQYEDPSEWYASDEYYKYYEDGLWNKIFWDYAL